jgi:uncharacterized membrane protein
MTAAVQSPATGKPARLAALDILRGFVMVVMTVDHSSDIFNAGRLFTDSVAFWKPETPLPAAQFYTRWITHLCAPTFVLLAGTALALSTAGRMKRGESARSIDRHIALRGALLIVLDAVWMGLGLIGPGVVLLQVLYAIGASLIAMVALRRLSDRALLGVGIALIVLDEVFLALLASMHLERTIPAALFVSLGFFFNGHFIVGYALFPWLGIMCCGWVLGRRLLAWPEAERTQRASRALAAWGAGLLATFVVVRGANSFGNMFLLRDDGSLVQWLHVSKYPPSISYDGLELGIACILLSILFVVVDRVPNFLPPLRKLGGAALFYYLLHVHVLALAGYVTGLRGKLGLGATYGGAALAVLVLYPLSAWYGRYKAANPGGWRQYI